LEKFVSPEHGDKRRFNRVRLNQKAWLKFKDISYESCRIKDINLTGLFVSGRFHQAVGDNCIMGYNQKHTASPFYFKAKARLVRMTKDGAALEFKSMTLVSYILLQSTLLYEAADPWATAYNLPTDCPYEINDDL